MKIAFLLMYELRAINKTIDSINKYIINFYNADVFIVCQETFDNDINNINLFDKNVKVKKLYKKKEPTEYYGINSNASLPSNPGNWNNNSNMQIYINNKEMLNNLESFIDDYDYFMILRSDSEILFPFPEIDLLEKIPPAIYTYNAKYCIGHGFVTGIFIHRNFIYNYLNKTYVVIKDNSINNILLNKCHLNQENFYTFCMKYQKLEFKYINNLNIYWTCNTLNDRSTCSKPRVNINHNVICKYDEQCEEAYENFDLWNQGKNWVYENDRIMLK